MPEILVIIVVGRRKIPSRIVIRNVPHDNKISSNRRQSVPTKYKSSNIEVLHLTNDTETSCIPSGTSISHRVADIDSVSRIPNRFWKRIVGSIHR